MNPTYPLKFVIVGRRLKFDILKKSTKETDDEYITGAPGNETLGIGLPDIKWGTVVFISDSGELYLNGNFYGGTQIDENDKVEIGDGLVVGNGNSIGNYVTIGTNAYIGDEAHIGTNDVIGANVNIGAGANIGANVKIGAGISITEKNNVLTISNNAGKSVTLNLE